MSSNSYLFAVQQAWGEAVDIYLASPEGQCTTAPYDADQIERLRTVLVASVVPPPDATAAEREDIMEYAKGLLNRRMAAGCIDVSWVTAAEACLADIARFRRVPTVRSITDAVRSKSKLDPRIFDEVEITVGG